jgi:O-antigen/teichoic acid export membrane protein
MLIIVAIAASKAVESVGDIVYGFFQHRERMDRIAQSMMIKGLMSVILFGVVVWISRSVLLGALSLAISWITVLITFDLRNLRKFFINERSLLRPAFSLDRIYKLSVVSFPLGIASVLMSVNSNVPRYFIDSYMGPAHLGIFAALSYPVVAGSVVIMALGQAVTPRLAELYSSNNIREFKSIVIKMAMVAFIMAIGGVIIAIFAGEPFLRIVYTSEYSKYPKEFIIVIAAGGISYFAFLLGYALTAAQRFSIQAISFAINLIVTIVAGFILIPMKGLLGAAYSMALGSISQILVEYIRLTSLVRSSEGKPDHQGDFAPTLGRGDS